MTHQQALSELHRGLIDSLEVDIAHQRRDGNEDGAQWSLRWLERALVCETPEEMRECQLAYAHEVNA